MSVLAEQIDEASLHQYNKELEHADSEIESGNYVSHEDAERLFKDRRKALSFTTQAQSSYRRF